MKWVNYSWWTILFFFNATCVLMAYDELKNEPWTWLYFKNLSKDEALSYKERNELYFVKDQVPSFTQLIFTWNANRPKKGHFAFWVQARDSDTKKWDIWHHMMDWGANIQRSYKKNGEFTDYHHVRLELKNDQLADAFRIKIVAHDNASLGFIKTFSVATSNFQMFKPEQIDQNILSLPSVLLEKVPATSQFQLDHYKADSLCSPTSCSILTSFLTQQRIDPIEFAESSYDHGLGVYGSWPFNMAHAYEICEGDISFFTARLNSFVRLHQRLMQGIPVVVSVRGYLQGQASPYRYGHLLVVVGYDAKKREVIVHDPAFKTDKSTIHRYQLKGFMQAWERSHRLAYLAQEAT
jgi:hypothetical protein